MTDARALPVLAAKLRLDRAFVGFVLGSVVVLACLGADEVGNDEWGMVRSLGQYQAILVAVLAASLLAQEVERGTLAWGLTQGVGRVRWLAWRTWLPLTVTVLGAAGLGLVTAVVRDAAPAVWLADLPAGSLAGLDWQWAVGAGVLGFAVGVLCGAGARRVVPAVSLAGPAMVGVTLAVDVLRGRLLDTGDDLAVAAWVGLGAELLVAALLLAVAARVVRDLDV